MLMSKNVNNDVSKDSPIDGRQIFDGIHAYFVMCWRFPCWHTRDFFVGILGKYKVVITINKVHCLDHIKWEVIILCQLLGFYRGIFTNRYEKLIEFVGDLGTI